MPSYLGSTRGLRSAQMGNSGQKDGLAILLTVLPMNLFGDWLRDKLDLKLRNV